MSDRLQQMRDEWQSRAEENAPRYIAGPGYASTSLGFPLSGIDDCYHLLRDVHPHLAADMTVLEVGCGIGRMLQFLARVFAHVKGVDVAPAMVSQAREYLALFPNVEILCGDGQTLPFADDSIDFAYSNAVFQHIPDVAVIESYLRETHRVLRDGRVCKYMVKTAPWPHEPDEKGTWFGANIDLPQVQRWAEDIGFDILAAEDVDGYVGWVTLQARPRP